MDFASVPINLEQKRELGFGIHIASLPVNSPHSKGHHFLCFAKMRDLWNNQGTCAAFHHAALLISSFCHPCRWESSLWKAMESKKALN